MNLYYQLFTVWCVLWSRVCRTFGPVGPDEQTSSDGLIS